jgi:large subunit ribosomal protein L20
MSRTKTGTVRRARHNKVLKANKGMRGANKRLYKRAHEAYLHSGQYAYEGRKNRKRDIRRLWNVRINAAVRQADETMTYSKFINGMKKANIALDRKVLADLAVNDFNAFKTIVDTVRA